MLKTQMEQFKDSWEPKNQYCLWTRKDRIKFDDQGLVYKQLIRSCFIFNSSMHGYLLRHVISFLVPDQYNLLLQINLQTVGLKILC